MKVAAVVLAFLGAVMAQDYDSLPACGVSIAAHTELSPFRVLMPHYRRPAFPTSLATLLRLVVARAPTRPTACVPNPTLATASATAPTNPVATVGLPPLSSTTVFHTALVSEERLAILLLAFISQQD